MKTSANKAEILTEYESKADKVQNQYAKGHITDEERRQSSSRSGPRRPTR